eukprot:9231274-Ditylum_brightwellii.AAC.1
MDKRLSGRPAANGHILLGTVVIKYLQALVYWVKDRHNMGLPLVAADFNAEAIAAASADKAVRKELKAKLALDISKLGKFDPDPCDAYEDAFTNHLGDCIEVQGKPLHYVVRNSTLPTTFSTTEQEMMFQIHLVGNAYGLDNAMVFRKLKAFLIDGPGLAWIEAFDSIENGCAAFFAWANHYNGQVELSKCIALAKAKLKG